MPVLVGGCLIWEPSWGVGRSRTKQQPLFFTALLCRGGAERFPLTPYPGHVRGG